MQDVRSASHALSWSLGIFASAMSGPQRAAYLREACADDRALRSEVESLLAAADARERAEDRLAGTDNTPPFRFRRWLFAQAHEQLPVGPLARKASFAAAGRERGAECLRHKRHNLHTHRRQPHGGCGLHAHRQFQ